MRRIILLALLVLTVSSSLLHAQCSDAGVCVVGSQHTLLGHRVGGSYAFGKSGEPDDLTIHSFRVEGDFQLFRDARLTILFPWSLTNGPLGQASGIGDLTVLWNQTTWEVDGSQLNIQFGGKFATGATNSGNLSQAYQPGLGTNDFLFGLSYETEPWLFAFGYQLSRGRSNNSVTRLKRGDDLLARIGYETHVDGLTVGMELLTIKRLQESSVLDPADATGNSFMTVPGSDQFQINLLARGLLPLSETCALRGLVAVPLRSRSINVDGLTRSITIAIGIQYSL